MSSYPHISYEEHQAIVDRLRRELTAAQARERELLETLKRTAGALGAHAETLIEYEHYKEAAAYQEVEELCSEILQRKPNHTTLDALLEQARLEAVYENNEYVYNLFFPSQHWDREGRGPLTSNGLWSEIGRGSHDLIREQAWVEEQGRILSQIEPLFDEWRRGDDGSDDYPPLGAFIAAAIRGEK